MKFCYFSSVPWPFLAARPPQWPFPNSAFNAARGCDVIHSQLALFAFAEECGFDWVAIGEDHMSAYSLVPDPCTFVGALCRCTSSAKLAILGLPIPLLNPVRVAEQCALLDLLSGGRLRLGILGKEYSCSRIPRSSTAAIIANCRALATAIKGGDILATLAVVRCCCW